jgi:hypothetical protein
MLFICLSPLSLFVKTNEIASRPGIGGTTATDMDD